MEFKISSSIIIVAVIRFINYRKVCTYINNRFSFLTFLCSNDNNTRSSLGTIDSRRRSIFQHINLCNIVRINFRKFTIERHTI